MRWGTPILVGVSSGLSTDPEIARFAAERGYAEWSQFLAMIGFKVAFLHTIAGTLVPLLVLAFMTRFFGANRSFVEGLRVWKFALFAAFAMTVPYLIVARLLGPEFPAMFGGLAGLAIVVPAARKGFLVPRKEDTWDFESREKWEPEWTGSIAMKDDASSGKEMGAFKAWSPYLLVGCFLVLTRLRDLPFLGWLQSWTLTAPNLFGTDITVRAQPLYLPGTVFVAVSLITFLLHRMKADAYWSAWGRSIRTMGYASVALIFTVPMVQVFINSGGGEAGFERMPIVLADGVAHVGGRGLADFCPVHWWARSFRRG